MNPDDFEEYQTNDATLRQAQTDSDGGDAQGMNDGPAPLQGNPLHVYVGRDERGDVWQTFDAPGNRVLEWAVAPGNDSRDTLPGTLRDLGPPSPYTAAQGPQTPAPARETASTAAAGNIGDTAHKYVGTDGRGDVYQLYDAASGNVLEWAVKVNDDSRNIIPGSLRNLGAPSRATVAQAPAGNATLNTGTPGNQATPTAGNQLASAAARTGGTPLAANANAFAGVIGDSSHKYVGTDSRGDVYQLYDAAGNRVLEWAVAVNADSRDIIPGTLRDLGPPSGATIAQRTNASTAGSTGSAVPGNISGSTAFSGVPGSYQGDTGGTTQAGTGQPRQADTRHKYVGRDSRGDVWQIFDGTNVIEWAVKAGDLSSNIIPGSGRNLGPPSPATIAQDDGFRAGGPEDLDVSSVASGGQNTRPGVALANETKPAALVWIGLAASVISALR